MVGTAKIARFTTSAVGVSTAAATKIPSTAQRKLRSSKRGGDQADARRERQRDRQLEHQPEAEDDGQQEAVVTLGGDHRLEIGGHVEQELDREREGDVVGERPAGEEEEPAEGDERPDPPPLPPVEPGRDEPPRLPEQEREREKDTGQQGGLEVEQERIGDAEDGELRALRQVAQDRDGEKTADLGRPVQAGRDADREREQAAKEAAAELLEVLEERHARQLLGSLGDAAAARLGLCGHLRSAASARPPARRSAAGSAAGGGAPAACGGAPAIEGGTGVGRRGGSSIAISVSIERLRSLEARRNSESPLPIVRPISGRRRGPKMSRARTRMKRISGKPRDPNT